MAVEAEIKARVRHLAQVQARLALWAAPQGATYRDAYFDRAGELTTEDRELRVREIQAAGAVTCLLTYKGPTLDAASGSKTERTYSEVV